MTLTDLPGYRTLQAKVNSYEVALTLNLALEQLPAKADLL